MSLGPLKPVTPDIATQMSQAWVDPNKNKKKKAEERKRDKEEKNSSNDTHRILKKAFEAKAPKVNIVDETGKKVAPDVSGMVINILT